jgi:ribonuclease P protein component
MPNTFNKHERLRRRNTILQIFANGEVVVKYPFRAVFALSKADGFPLCEVLFSVPKKRFKRANKRNLLRRRMREAYRLQKEGFYQKLAEKDLQLSMALIYLPTEELDYAPIYKGMGKLMDKILHHIEQAKTPPDGTQV